MDRADPWYSLQKACAIATKGVEADEKRKYEEAVRFYDQSEGYFLHSIKHEAKSDRMKDLIRNKCKDYLDRAEKLKTYLEKKEISNRFIH